MIFVSAKIWRIKLRPISAKISSLNLLIREQPYLFQSTHSKLFSLSFSFGPEVSCQIIVSSALGHQDRREACVEVGII